MSERHPGHYMDRPCTAPYCQERSGSMVTVPVEYDDAGLRLPPRHAPNETVESYQLVTRVEDGIPRERYICVITWKNPNYRGEHLARDCAKVRGVE